MAGEVVGTAYVRIKALTDKLAKDINKSVAKSMEDAKLDKVGEEGGEKLGKSLGDSTVDSMEDTVKDRSKDLDFKSLFRDATKRLESEGLFDSDAIFPDDFGEKFRENNEKNHESVRRAMQSIRSEFGDPDAFDIDLPFAEPGRFENFFDRMRANVRGYARDFREARRSTNEDGDAIGRSLDSLTRKLKDLSGGQSVPTGGFLAKSLVGIGGAITAALPYIQDVGSAVLAYATGLVAQVGFLTTALGGLGAAAGAAIGGAILPIIPIMLAFKSETEAFIEFKDSLKAAGEEFLRIGTATQATLLPALDEAIFQMGELVPMFSEYGLFVGQVVGDYARLAAAVLTGEMAQGRFAEILRSSLRILDLLLPTAINAGNILSGIWVAATPIAERFAGTLFNMVERWRDIINFGLYTGTLTRTLEVWYDRAELVGSALGNLSGAIFDILQVGGDSADSVFVRFDEWAQRYRDWTESEVGQNKLKLIFDNSLAVMREINGVVADLFDGIFGRLEEVGGADSMVEALQGFREALPDIKEGIQGIIDSIDGINRVVGPALMNKLRQAFEELREPIGRLVYAILDVMRAMEESGAFETFLDLLRILADVLSAVLSIPGFGTFVGYLVAFGGAAKVATFALGPLVGVLGPFVTVLKTLQVTRGATALLNAANGLIGFSSAAKGAAGAASATKGVQLALEGMGAATAAGPGGGLAGALSKVGPAMGVLGPVGIAAGVGLAAYATHAFLANKRTQEFEQDVRQATDALGLLNGGLNVTAEGIEKYLREESRFVGNKQKDDIERMGFSFGTLAEQVEKGTLSQVDFAEAAMKSGEVTAVVGGIMSRGGGFKEISTSLSSLQDEYDLTDAQVRKLAEGQAIYADGTRITLGRNSSVLESFKELREVVGQAAKDNIGAFVLDEQNIRLLGIDVLANMKRSIDEADPGAAGALMAENLDRLGAAAAADTAKIKGLSDAIRNQVSAQYEHLSGNEKVLAINAALRSEQEKLFTQIRSNLQYVSDLSPWGNLGKSVRDFSDIVKTVDFSDFSELARGGDIDKLLDDFPGLADATYDLFTNLEGLPEDKFKAIAETMNLSAESLREAMDGAAAAIANLEETALSKLPSVGQLLDEATGVNEENGEQIFDKEGFRAGIEKRIDDTTNFGSNIRRIFRDQGHEAAALAAQLGPQAAANIAEMSTGKPGEGLNESLKRLEGAEQGLRTAIRDTVGPGIALEYLGQAERMSTNWGIGLANGVNSEVTLEALKGSSVDTLNYLAKGFKGHFVIHQNGDLEFVHTGSFGSTRRRQTVTHRSNTPTGGGGKTLSKGGFVPGTFFNNGPFGTDTVPAWLTPGEFVLRRKIAQAIPPGVLNSLNAGDTRLLSLLNSVSRNRPGSPNARNTVTAVPVGRTGNGIVVENMTVVAPSPLDASRQVVDRLRILQAQSIGF